MGAAYTLRGGSDECRPAVERCAAQECDPRRPACTEQQSNERLRRYCAENPCDAKCR
ncbi:MAG: hypothetical protein AABX89_03765 [Candidatus Thermoplasmatota archaeon]